MNRLTFEINSYKLVATEQPEPNIWLCHEHSDGKLINTYAASTDKVMTSLLQNLSTRHKED